MSLCRCVVVLQAALAAPPWLWQMLTNGCTLLPHFHRQRLLRTLRGAHLQGMVALAPHEIVAAGAGACFELLAVDANAGGGMVHTGHQHDQLPARKQRVARRDLHPNHTPAADPLATQQRVMARSQRVLRHTVVEVPVEARGFVGRAVIQQRHGRTVVGGVGHLRGLLRGHQRAFFHEHGDGAQRNGYRDPLAAGVALPVKAVPGAGRQVQRALLRAFLQHGAYQQVRAPEVLILHGERGGIVRVVKIQGRHQRLAFLGLQVAQAVVIREEQVAPAHGFLGCRAPGCIDQRHFAGKGEGCFIDVVQRRAVRPEDGRKGRELQPAHVQLAIAFAAGKAARVAVHVGDAAHGHAQQHRQLRAEAAPVAAHVAGPGKDAEALRAGKAAAVERKETLVGVLLCIVFIQHLRPVVAVNVVHFVGAEEALRIPEVAEVVVQVGRVALGLAEVAPPAFHAEVHLLFIELPEPGLGIVAKQVEQAAAAEVEVGKVVGLAGAVYRQEGLRSRVVGRRFHQERLGDEDGVDALLFKTADHAFGVGPLLAVHPIEVAHGVLDGVAEPEQVEDDGFHGHALAGHFCEDIGHLRLASVAEAAHEVAEGPARRQGLRAGELVVGRECLRVVAQQHVHAPLARGGAPFEGAGGLLADVGIAARGVVEEEGVAVGGGEVGHAVIEVVGALAVAVPGVVVEREAVAAAVEGQGALAAAEDALAAAEGEAEAGGVAVAEQHEARPVGTEGERVGPQGAQGHCALGQRPGDHGVAHLLAVRAVAVHGDLVGIGAEGRDRYRALARRNGGLRKEAAAEEQGAAKNESLHGAVVAATNYDNTGGDK